MIRVDCPAQIVRLLVVLTEDQDVNIKRLLEIFLDRPKKIPFATGLDWT
ncbi:hypothetical protein [Parasphingorhabdus sp.]